MTRTELVEQIKSKQSFLCVGLDTDIEKIPAHYSEQLTVRPPSPPYRSPRQDGSVAAWHSSRNRDKPTPGRAGRRGSK